MEGRKRCLSALFFGFNCAGLLAISDAEPSDGTGSGSNSYSLSSAVQYPCTFRGQILLHNRVMRLDPCTYCRCLNGSVTCIIENCPADLGCGLTDIVVIREECCPQCPYRIFVSEATITDFNNFSFTVGDTKRFRFGLDIIVNRKQSSRVVRGQKLWKLSSWFSRNENGSGPTFAFQDNIFSDRNAAMEHSKPNYPPMYWTKLGGTLHLKNATCDDYKYFCVEFGQQSQARPLYNLSFTFQSQKERLIDCVRLGTCKDYTECNYQQHTLRDNERLELDKCTTCTCRNKIVTCETEICGAECEEGKDVTEECCPVYPYRLYPESTSIIYISDQNFTTGTQTLNVTFGLNITVDRKKTSRFILGTNLWELTAWVTSRIDGGKNQIEETVFSEEDSSKGYDQRKNDPPWMAWERLHYEIDLSSGSCNDFQYFCVRFRKTKTPSTTYDVDLDVITTVSRQTEDCMELGYCTEGSVAVAPNSLLQVVCLTVILVLLLSLILFFLVKRRRLYQTVRIQLENTRDVEPLLKSKEINLCQVTLKEELGKGEFGVVYKGVITGLDGYPDNMAVAVKTTKVGALAEANEDLLDEMKLLSSLGEHRNIMSLVACCSRREPFYLITEYMQFGDLLNFLRRCREEGSSAIDPIYSLGEVKQIIVARDITNGMAYMENAKCYHGDLAARNVLVGDGLKVKISDFGMSDDIYTRGYKRQETADKKIPVKWCSLETIFSGICSSKSDVWSFGVVLHEIFTLGGSPYPGMALRFLVNKLREGYRMEKAEHCPDDIYQLMLRCWQEDPADRPKFVDLSEELGELLAKRCDYIQFSVDDEMAKPVGENSHGRMLTSGSTNPQLRQPQDLHPIDEDGGEVDVTELLAVLQEDEEGRSLQSRGEKTDESMGQI
ncbi:uncharacterized protein [Apostichopus japonicus]|uniref:uncharacterized protein n=1 Tax=Stichopus japonicus TaxID=307972 RepID=UPI003AB53CC6